MSGATFAFINQAIAERAQQQLLRQTSALLHFHGMKLKLANGQYCHNFASNDYLGLAHSPWLQAQLSRLATQHAVGSGASPLVTGRHPAHQALAEQLADWLGYEQVLLFSSGFAANMAVLSAFKGQPVELLLDRLAHASLVDGAVQHGKFKRFAHNDCQALAGLLGQSTAAHQLIVSEGVFSMDGDLAPFAQLSQLVDTFPQSALMLDDAHGFGVLNHGKGSTASTVWHHKKPAFYMATFGKAIGTSGAFIASTKENIAFIQQFARHYIYSTALPPVMAALTGQVIARLQHGAEETPQLERNMARFSSLALSAGLISEPMQSAICPVVLGSSARALGVSEQLKQRGFYVPAIRPPTVPNNTARLRVTLSAAHSVEQIEQLVDAIVQVLANETDLLQAQQPDISHEAG